MSIAATLDWLPEETIIPNLPNDIAMLCLARVPRQYHPYLAAVSKPIHSIVTSPEFFGSRSHLNHSEEVLYLRFGSDLDSASEIFAVNRDPSGDSPARVAPIRPLPEHLLVGSATVALGRSIYVIGGWTRGDRSCRGVPTPVVWVLDCRLNTWSRGPDMLAARTSGVFATVLGGRIYVLGGAVMSTDPFAEVLDPASGRWEAVPDPPGNVSSLMNVEQSVALGNKIYTWLDQSELRFDTEAQMWETREVSREEVLYFGDKCVVEERLYGYDLWSESVKWLDVTGSLEWKDVSMKWVPEKLPCSSKMVSVGGRLMFIAGQKKSLVFFSSDIEIVVSKKMIFEKWFISIKVGENFYGGSNREARWSDEVFFPQKFDAPGGTSRYNPDFVLPNWNCFSVSL